MAICHNQTDETIKKWQTTLLNTPHWVMLGLVSVKYVWFSVGLVWLARLNRLIIFDGVVAKKSLLFKIHTPRTTRENQWTNHPVRLTSLVVVFVTGIFEISNRLLKVGKESPPTGDSSPAPLWAKLTVRVMDHHKNNYKTGQSYGVVSSLVFSCGSWCVDS